MIAEGIGCYIEFVEEWNKLHDASKNCVIIQDKYIGQPAFMSFRGGKIELEL